ncbi:MAG TPA: MlaD family protein [Candidatus Acidoferrales bacterium]|nr:MlaD family protein [Candidatus Acidoferrales bacterium]
MKSRFTTLRVGILIAVGIGLFCFSIFSIGYGFRHLRSTGMLQAHFRRTNGLVPGAPVSLAGVNVGAVHSMAFPDDPVANYVIVRMWIEERAFNRMSSDSIAQIRTMGLLGDKYIEITDGSPNAPRLQPGATIAARDPIDYEEVFQKEGTQDVLANVIAISGQLRALLESVNSGQGLLGELVKGQGGPEQERLTLASIRQSFDSLTKLASQLQDKLNKFEKSKSLVAAVLSDKNNGQRMINNFSNGALSVQEAAKATQLSAQTLKEILDEYEHARGAWPRILKDQQYGDQLLANLRDSSAALRDILQKIDSGQGSLGLAVNDPRLYENANSFLSGTGLGVGFVKVLYSITHPFASPDSSQTAVDDPRTVCVEPQSAGR